MKLYLSACRTHTMTPMHACMHGSLHVYVYKINVCSVSGVAIYFSEVVTVSNREINILEFIICFIFKLFHFKEFDDYVTLHNSRSMPLTYVVTLYHIQ